MNGVRHDRRTILPAMRPARLLSFPALPALLGLCALACHATPGPVTPAAAAGSEGGASGGPTPARLQFWHDVRAHEDAPPEGADVLALAEELVGYLGATDAKIRDGLAYELLERWIRRDARLSPAELRVLTSRLIERLHAGIGEVGDDSVFGRSFAALVLSVIAARELDAPFMTDAELASMVDAAGWYAQMERDVRGYVPERGWAHAAAHTADWMKFLARHPRLTSDQTAVLLEAVLSFTIRRHGFILHHGEDGRLARPVLELLRKGRIGADRFAAWLARLAAPLAQQWGGDYDAELHAQQLNARNVIFTLFVILSVEPTPSTDVSAALAALHTLIAS
jgi:hypothetical protein